MSVFIRDFNLKSAVDLGLVDEQVIDKCDLYRDHEGNITIVPAENKTSIEDIVLNTETKGGDSGMVVMPKTVLKAMVNGGLIKESALESFDISIGQSTQYKGMELAFIKPRSTKSLKELLNSDTKKEDKSQY